MNCPAHYLPDVLPELDVVDEKERVFLSQQRRRKGHWVERDITPSNVEQPRHLSLDSKGVRRDQRARDGTDVTRSPPKST